MTTKAVMVLVNYYGEEELSAYVRQYIIHEQNAIEKLYIINNGSKNLSSLSTMAEQHPWIKILNLQENIGYLPAAERALQDYINENKRFPSALILSNYDLVPDSAGWLQHLIQWAVTEKLDVFTPQIIAVPGNRAMNPFYGERLKVAHIQRLLRITSSYPVYLIYQWLHRLKRRVPLSSHHSLYAIHGSFLGFTKTFFEKNGTTNYPCTLYGEELFIAEQVRQLNLRMDYHRQLRLLHHEHTSTGTVKNKKHMQFLHRSLKFIYTTYYT